MKNDKELVDYFISETNKKFDLVTDDLKEIRRDVLKLNYFRISSLAIVGIISSILSFGMSVVFLYLEKM